MVEILPLKMPIFWMLAMGDNPHDGFDQPVSCIVIAPDHGRPHLRHDKAHCAVQHEQAIEA
jgi:hypothetical protein